MKNRLFIGFSLFILAVGMVVINGCKDTATDPGYIPLAEIRFANFHQVQPIQIFMYPESATPADSATLTPTAMTYGLVTPYLNNLSTNRATGKKYHLVALEPDTKVVVADDYVTLMPGDKKTWLISGNGGTASVDHTLIEDNPPSGGQPNLAYFRFVNVTPDHTPLNLVVGDPLKGMVLASNIAYKGVSQYVGIPTANDTSITLYVTDPSNNNVLGRLAGVGLGAGTYRTITWGGADARIPDPTTGLLTLNDTVRIRIFDDDPGTDITVTPPLTFRFNFINALLPPNIAVNKVLIDYSLTGGLNLVINNNTSYDYTGLMPFSLAPPSPSAFPPAQADNGALVYNQIPATIPMVDVLYFKLVKPFNGAKNPSSLDTNLFRLYANKNIIKSDQLYTILVYDTVKKNDSKATNNNAPYDSAAGTMTVPIPDVPVAGSARIILGYALAGPNKPLPATSNNNAIFSVNGVVDTKIKNVKAFDSSITVSVGHVDLEAKVSTDTDVHFGFNAEDGAIYEAFLVGQRGRHDGLYDPKFIVVRVNPVR